MSEYAGMLNEVYVCSTGAITAATGTKIDGVNNSTLNKLAAMLDRSQFGTGRVKRISGIKDANISLSGHFSPLDTDGQMALEAGDTVYIGLYPLGANSSQGAAQIEMLVQDFGQSATIDDQTFSCTLQGTGTEPVALPAQST